MKNLSVSDQIGGTKSIASILDNYDEQILANIRNTLASKNMSRNDLRDQLKTFGYDVSSFNSYIPEKKVTKKGIKRITLQWLIVISEALDISVDSLLSRADYGTSKQTNTKDFNEITRDFLESMLAGNADYFYDASNDIHRKAFKSLSPKYYCYFFSTNTNEKYDVIESELDISQKNGLYIVSFHIGNRVLRKNKPLPNNNESTSIQLNKNYRGFLVISNALKCCFCFLIGEEVAELNLFIIRNFTSAAEKGNKMDTRVAELLTVSSGENRYPTTERFLLSRSRIDPEVLLTVTPHLRMNRSTIDIQTKNLYEIIQHEPGWEKLLNKCIDILPTGESQVCSINEDFIKQINTTLDEKLKEDDLRRLFSTMRGVSIAEPYNKVNKEVDDAVRQLLFNMGYFADNSK
jgi:hypothetical protein